MTTEQANPLIRKILNRNEMKTVLLIDNDPLSTVRISELMRHPERRIIHAPSEEQGRKLLRSEKPDLIIHHISERSQSTADSTPSTREGLIVRGIPLLRIIRRLGFPGAAPEILGPKQYLIDPFTPSELVSAVEDHLRNGNLDPSATSHSQPLDRATRSS